MSVYSPIKVGITGGIGSGKSVVCRMFAMLGAYVYDSDAQAKRLMTSDLDLMANIKRRFGDDIYKDNSLDRALLASRVFGNQTALTELNAMVHPAVIADFLKKAEKANTPYVIVESAVLFESGMDKEVSEVVTVSAPEELRLKRAVGRDGASPEMIKERMMHQMTDGQREAAAGYVILNDERHLVWTQVLKLDAIFRQVSRYNKTDS